MGAPLFGARAKYKVDAEGKNLTGLRGKTKEELKAIVDRRKERNPDSYKSGSTREGSSYFYNDIVEVRMPTFTIGVCRNNKKCKQYDVELGDGYCIDCYDKAMEKQSNQKRNEILQNGL